jgi:hypothetical protein
MPLLPLSSGVFPVVLRLVSWLHARAGVAELLRTPENRAASVLLALIKIHSITPSVVLLFSEPRAA